MTSRSRWFWIAVLLVTAAALCSCGGGDSATTPGPGPAFSLYMSADPEVGASPLTVTFQAVPSGGFLPYTYAWDFNGDGVTDSNAPNGTYIYENTTVMELTVTDAEAQIVTANKTITITGVDPGQAGSALDVRYNATPQTGNVPFNVQFEAFVSGGKPPYKYSWDFDGDGVFDAFIKDPLYTFEEIGTQVGNNYVFFPVLKVEDNRGVVSTNFDDRDADGNPDFRIQINALPPQGGMNVAANGNPLTGQAPLTVEFTGAVTGGSGTYEFTWNFGDGHTSAPLKTSIATHTYINPGTYTARCTARDLATSEVATAAPITIVASPEQEFELAITSDVTAGQVPFVVNFEALPVNGKSPINYEWDIFTDTSPGEEDPSVGNPPGLAAAAVVTPDFSIRKNPTIHFGNTAETGGAYNYVARCVASDDAGNVAVSNLIRITATPNTTYPYYECQRPLVVGQLLFPAFLGGESANPVYQAYPVPAPWAPRANPAVCSHPAGVTYVLGGEILDANGNFERLVNRGDSAYAFVPATQGTGTGEAAIGKYNTGARGVVIKLNDDTGPAFPGSPQTLQSPEWPDPGGDTAVPPVVDPEDPPFAQPPPRPTMRSAPFTIVGSAAAVFIHERPETNPAGAYPGPAFCATSMPFSFDRDIAGFPQDRLWVWCDAPTFGWGCETAS